MQTNIHLDKRLKSCPYCGSRAKICIEEIYGLKIVTCDCAACGRGVVDYCYNNGEINNIIDSMVEKWNSLNIMKKIKFPIGKYGIRFY